MASLEPLSPSPCPGSGTRGTLGSNSKQLLPLFGGASEGKCPPRILRLSFKRHSLLSSEARLFSWVVSSCCRATHLLRLRGQGEGEDGRTAAGR